jgi:pyruvate/2-oxoglutarate dehydrogenase complex dihydrolipoamide acyltransferase (E2) component
MSRVKASPLARKIAKDKGINLNDVKGSAEGGRIVKKDIEGFTPSTKEVQHQLNRLPLLPLLPKVKQKHLLLPTGFYRRREIYRETG